MVNRISYCVQRIAYIVLRTSLKKEVENKNKSHLITLITLIIILVFLIFREIRFIQVLILFLFLSLVFCLWSSVSSLFLPSLTNPAIIVWPCNNRMICPHKFRTMTTGVISVNTATTGEYKFSNGGANSGTLFALLYSDS